MSKIYQKMTPEEKNRSKGVLGGFIHKVILKCFYSESQPYSAVSEGLYSPFVIPEGCNRESHPYNTAQQPGCRVKTSRHDGIRQGCPAKIFGYDDNINNVILRSRNSEFRPYFAKRAGFTLIELLVVVLILGILAAVAMPSYRRAVATARVGTLLPLLRSISDAENRFYMANNRYTRSFSSLDISMPSGGELITMSNGNEEMVYADFHCYFYTSEEAAAQGSSSSLYCVSKKVSGLRIEKYFGAQYFICWADKNNEEANVICQNISGRDTHNATPTYAYGYTF